MKILVTGCSGFIGAAFVDLMVTASDYCVLGIDRVEPKQSNRHGFHFIKCDLSSPGNGLESEEFSGVDAVVHLAAARGDWAISEADYWRDNVAATKGLLTAPWARSVKNWIFMSSVSVYGPADRPLNEKAPCSPVGPYGESKLASENLFHEFVSSNGLRGCVIRPSAVFSAGHPTNTNVYKLIESLRRFPFPLIGGGKNRKTLTYLPNLLDLVLWCLGKLTSSEIKYAIYNYVEEPVQTVSELISSLKGAGLLPCRRVSVPLPLALALSYPIYAVARLTRVDLRVTPERVRKFVSSTWYDASLVRDDGFEPKVSLADALTTTAKWHMSQG